MMEFIPQSAEKEIERTLDRVGAVVNQIQGAQRSILELQSQATIYRGLATIGIAASVFGHETQSSLAGFVGATYNISRFLKQSPPNIGAAITSIDTAKKYADQVGSWGKFALARIRTDKRRKGPVDMKELATEIADALEPAMGAVNIRVIRQLATVEGNTFAMDAEAVLLNLLTNAYTACQQTKRRRVIRIKLNAKTVDGVDGCELTVADSGPGVASEFRDRVWDPLFSTKIDEGGRQIGTGLGLAIVQSIVTDLKGRRRVDTDSELRGARFIIWLPLE
jgi:signal transduction histidine kinase